MTKMYTGIPKKSRLKYIQLRREYIISYKYSFVNRKENKKLTSPEKMMSVLY